MTKPGQKYAAISRPSRLLLIAGRPLIRTKLCGNPVLGRFLLVSVGLPSSTKLPNNPKPCGECSGQATTKVASTLAPIIAAKDVKPRRAPLRHR